MEWNWYELYGCTVLHLLQTDDEQIDKNTMYTAMCGHIAFGEWGERVDTSRLGKHSRPCKRCSRSHALWLEKRPNNVVPLFPERS